MKKPKLTKNRPHNHTVLYLMDIIENTLDYAGLEVWLDDPNTHGAAVWAIRAEHLRELQKSLRYLKRVGLGHDQ
jgi:hypothetical protein